MRHFNFFASWTFVKVSTVVTLFVTVHNCVHTVSIILWNYYYWGLLLYFFAELIKTIISHTIGNWNAYSISYTKFHINWHNNITHTNCKLLFSFIIHCVNHMKKIRQIRISYSHYWLSAIATMVKLVTNEVINIRSSPCKSVLLLSNFNHIWIFSTDFSKTDTI